MKKRAFALLMTASLVMGIVPAVSVSAGEVTELTFFHYQEQYQEQFDKLVEMYQGVNPDVKLNVEIVGADYDMVFSTRAATDEIPDIFMSGPFSQNGSYIPYSYMMTNEEFMADVNDSLEFKTAEGEDSAVPFSCQAWGVLYNKEIFEKAGITELPDTLEELEAACAQLQEAGFTPFVQGYNSSYIVCQMFGFPWAMDADFQNTISKVLAGEVELSEVESINKLLDCIEIVKKYTQENPYNDDFAAAGAKLGTGEGAMMISGDWIVENALKANPDAKIGIMALPVSENPEDAFIYASNSTGLHVNKDSENLDAALEFIDWLVTSEEGKKWMSEDMKVLSAIKGVTPVDSVVLADATEYINAGKSVTWGAYLFPSGLEAELEPVYDKFLLDEVTREEAIAEMGEIWKSFE